MSLVEQLKQAVKDGFQEALFGSSMAEWQAYWANRLAMLRSGVSDVIAIVVIAWVFSGLLMVLESKSEAKMLRTTLYTLAVSRALGAILGSQ